MADQLDIVASQNEKYTFVIGANNGELRFDEIKIWLTKHVSKKRRLDHFLNHCLTKWPLIVLTAC